MDANLPPDQFLYGRMGPWPQPSPTHPLVEACEVLTIPPLELMQWGATIGQRYLQTQMLYAGEAAELAVKTIASNYLGPDDKRFTEIMLKTAYQRYLLPLSDGDDDYFKKIGIAPKQLGITMKYDFGAMDLVDPLPGLECAPTRVYLSGSPKTTQTVAAISVGDVLITPGEPAWQLAKVYALQGAAYHTLFVVHPALHFPMDSVNAVTKTAVPQAHPLFQLLFPHTTYTLPLDNAVLEGDASVVNNDPQGSWFDPLTSNAYNLKLLFAAGYTGLSDKKYRGAYPAYDYLAPPLLLLNATKRQPIHDTTYSIWQSAYFNRAFLPFCNGVAKFILSQDAKDSYVVRWARYLHVAVNGFPDETQILDADYLGRTLAIYLWDVSLAHGADHASFGAVVTPPEKFLRIRTPPPKAATTPSPTKTEQIANGDDLARQNIANQMFFLPWTMFPNLIDTKYAFTDLKLAALHDQFDKDLGDVAADKSLRQFMPLKSATPADYGGTIPATIQY